MADSSEGRLPRRSLTLLLLVLPVGTSTAQTICVDTSSEGVDFGGAQQVANLPGPDGKVSLPEAGLASDNTAGIQTIGFHIPQNEWLYQQFFSGRALLIGPRGAFTKLHFDLGASHSWNAQVLGRKRWLLISTDQMANCSMETRQSGGYFPGTDIETPDLERYPRLAKVAYRTGIVHPGEIIWFPSLWLHEVVSLDDTVSITHNYLNRDILLRALKHHMLEKVHHHTSRFRRLRARV